MPRLLLLPEQLDGQKCLPSLTHIQYHGQSQEREILHQDGHTFRLQ